MIGQIRRAGVSGVFSVIALLLTVAPVSAHEFQTAEENQVLRPRVGDQILRYIEAEQEGLWQDAANGYSALLEEGRLQPFEEATVLQLRGRVYYELEQPLRAVTDWRRAINLNALGEETNNSLRLNSGQLLIGEADYAGGTQLIETALAMGAPLSADIAMRMAQAYGQMEDFASGLPFARQAFDLADNRQQRHYSLLLFYFQNLDMQDEQLALVVDMVELWPEEKRYWSSWAALLARDGQEVEAFNVNVIMYNNGLLTENDELVRLVQYYAYNGYPYRAGDILSRELNSGRVEETPEHLRMLAGFWRQAREWDRALPVLHRVATTTGFGPDYEALGEALYQRGQFAEAEVMFEQALEQGNIRRPGDTMTLIGNSRFEQDHLLDAIDAFERALSWEYSRATAQGWIDFIERRIAIEAQGERFVHTTNIEGCENWLEAERRSVATRQTEFTEDGRRLFDLPSECGTYFNRLGERLPEWQGFL